MNGLDKLHLSLSEAKPHSFYLDRLEKLQNKVTPICESPYRYGFAFHLKQGGVMSVCTQPMFPNISPIQIRLNPKDFSHYRDLLGFLKMLSVPENATIARMDHAVTLDVPCPKIFQSLIIKRKQRFNDSKSNTSRKTGHGVTGFMVGVGREVYNVYDYSLKHKIGTNLTRIELQQKHRCLPFRGLNELERLLTIPVFQQAYLIQPDFDAVLDATEKKREILDSINHEFLLVGAHYTHSKYNRQQKFQRDYGRFFMKNPKFPDLDQYYKTHLRSWFL